MPAEMITQSSTTPFVDIDWKDDDAVRGFVSLLIRDRDDCNFERMRQSEINIAWLRGFQETRWHPRDRRLYRVPNPDNRPRVIVNLMSPLVEGYLAKLAGDSIAWEVQPATGDSGDFDISRISTQILQSYFHRLDCDTMVINADRWAVATGHAFMKVCWDPFGGEEAAQITAEDVGLPEDVFRREFKADNYSLRMGDLAIQPIPLFNITWGPYTAKFEDAEWVLVLTERSAAYCMERYGVDREDAKAAYDSSVKLYRPGGSGAFGTMHQKLDEETCLVAELWCKKNQAIKGLESGRHIVVVGQKVVKNGPNPYRHGRIPIVDYPLQMQAGQVRGETFVDSLIAPQANINVRLSQICEIAELSGNPVWLAQSGSIVNMDEWVNRRGGIRFFKSTPPQQIPGSGMPSAFVVEIDRNVRFMQDIAGIHDVSQAKNPAGTRSGRAIALLKEADDERLGPIAKSRRTFWSKIGRLALETIQQYVTEDRLAKVLGDENRWDTFVFSGKSVVGENKGPNTSYFDVRVKSNGMPNSRSTRQEAVMFLVERGFFKPDNPDDRHTVFEVMEFGSTRDPMDSTEDSRRRQQRYNETMATGQYAEPQEYEDHEVHLEELNKFRRKDRYLKMPPQIQQLFMQHEIARLQMMALKQLRLQAIAASAIQQAMSQMPPGALPQPGNNSGQGLDNNSQQPVVEPSDVAEPVSQ